MRILLTIMVSISMAISVRAQTFRVNLEIPTAPQLHGAIWRGELTLNKQAITFTPINTREFTQIKIIYSDIQRLNTIGFFQNRLVIEGEKGTWVFATYQANLIKRIIDDNHAVSTNAAWQSGTYLQRFPFLIPGILDFHYSGKIHLESNQVIWEPTEDQHIFQPINIPLASIRSVRVVGYWLLPKNVLVIKTNEFKYRFVLYDPKAFKKLLDQEL